MASELVGVKRGIRDLEEELVATRPTPSLGKDDGIRREEGFRSPVP